MKKKISKLIFMFILPIVVCLSFGFFLIDGFVSGYASALAQQGGCFSVGNNSTMNVGDGTVISGFSAKNGGGVYVSSVGEFIMNGGTISGNTATSGDGHNIYNAGTFTMNGGTIGVSGDAKTYGIYNTGTMEILGGTIYDNIYSSSTFTTSPSATLSGTITLGDSAMIVVQNYSGVTPEYKINIPSSRPDGTIVRIQGSETEPDKSKIELLGVDSYFYKIEVVRDSSSSEPAWNINIKDELYIRVDENGNEDENGNYVLFGMYPKTYQSDISMVTATQDSNGYYLGTDGKSRYVKVVAEPYADNYVFNDQTLIVSGQTYYFKLEPIKWRILNETNGKALLFCEDIIDSYCFNGTEDIKTINDQNIYPNNYKYSDVRAWLNGYSQETDNPNGKNYLNSGFLQKAFSKNAQNIITITNVDNSDLSVFSKDSEYTCENTNDKIFLLSDRNMLNTSYGFSSDHSEYDKKRVRKTTDYLRAKNFEYNTNVNYMYNGNYLLRSPAGADYNCSTFVSSAGLACYPFPGGITNPSGIVPALTISFNAKTCSHSLTITQKYIPIYDENGESIKCCLKKTYKCNTCGYSYFDIGEGKDHSYPETATKETYFYSDSGHYKETTKKCTKCSHTNVKKSEIEEHSGFSEIGTSYVSVGASGHQKKLTEKCSVCSYTRTTNDGDVIEHNFLGWISDTGYVCVNEEKHKIVYERYCKESCGYFETKENEEEHSYLTISTNTKENGSSGHQIKTVQSCKYCDHELTTTKTESHSLSTVSTSVVSDGSSGHHTETNQKCASCSYTTIVKSSTTNHLFLASNTTTEIVSDGSSGHHTETTKTCKTCSYKSVTTGTIEEHSLTTSYSYEYLNDTHHNQITKKSCSTCSYSTSSMRQMLHALSNIDQTCVCGYSKYLAFDSRVDCEDCLTETVLNQDILVDDKKKFQTQLVFDEKRYINDLIQLPRVGT